MSRFQNKQVVVTGGTGALGTAVVGRLLDEGAEVLVPVFVASELARFPYREHARVTTAEGVDLANEASVVAFFARADRLFASIHLVGGFSMAPFHETSFAEYEKLLSMNATSVFLSCREAVRRLRAIGEGGRIVNVAAKPALVPTGGIVTYAATKAFVAGLTTSLAEEAKADGIWVNAVVPSTMDTPANRAAMPSADFAAWPKVEEVAETILFLASPENAATRGALVPVYGRS